MKGKRIFFIILGVLIIWTIFYTFPKSYKKTFYGVKYQLGEENKSYTEDVKIEFDGYYNRNIVKSDIFEGKIYVNDDIVHSFFYNSLYTQIVDQNISFYKKRRTLIDYIIYGDYGNRGEISNLGTIYLNEKLDKLTINIMLKDKNDPTLRSWSGEDGFMISSPATNREEALALSNKLMKKMLINPLN